jgi:hypothetical protein
MSAFAGMVISRGVGNLRRVQITRRDEAVDERRGRIAEDLRRTRLIGGLREVVVLHRDHEDRADRSRIRSRRKRLLRQQTARRGSGEQRRCEAELFAARMEERTRVVCTV